MGNWTHLIRFIAKEDHQLHLGQLVDTSRDVGKDSVDGVEIKAYLIRGTIFDGKIVTGAVYTVERLLSPISPAECSYIRCLGLNYKDHAQEGGFALPEVPVLFTKPRTALADPYPAAVTIPRVAQDGTSDYEAELCVVIGRSGRDIPEAEALDHVLGYTASNDISARKLQLATSQWSFGKGLDGSCPLGPALVSPSAIPDPQTLAIKALYNGAVVQDGHTSDMIFSVRRQIAHLSQGTTLEAGSIILTGTPAGIGFFRKPPVVLEHGGDVRVEIEGIGTLVNRVCYEDD
ncbi:putative fumarylacetoacetate hydrolase [Rosellinia necatrix]|uniref:Putative fumarylacetoacetate hydrolase n=1 Tax=Rosellinia necatrix TaxID=77044 RepID=A0A1W2TAP9_ROSNE|nr:putative fumarylacetoacetate hydrolase [Rosellinia necatrix]